MYSSTKERKSCHPNYWIGLDKWCLQFKHINTKSYIQALYGMVFSKHLHCKTLFSLCSKFVSIYKIIVYSTQRDTTHKHWHTHAPTIDFILCCMIRDHIYFLFHCLLCSQNFQIFQFCKTSYRSMCYLFSQEIIKMINNLSKSVSLVFICHLAIM